MDVVAEASVNRRIRHRPNQTNQRAAAVRFPRLELLALSPPVGQDAGPRIENSVIVVSVGPGDGTLGVLDKRAGQHWRQKPATAGRLGGATVTPRTLTATRHDAATNLDVGLVVQVNEGELEFTISLAAAGVQRRSLRCPHSFVTQAATPSRPHDLPV